MQSVRWYSKLKIDESAPYKSLLANHTNHNDGFFVSRQINSDIGILRQFARFNNRYEFNTVYNNMNECDKTFYEVIFGDVPQKIYFDLDIGPELNISQDEAIKIVEDLKECIIAVCRTYNDDVSDEHIMVFNTPSKPGEKISYHVVLTGFYVASNVHNKDICVRIRDMITEERHRQVIDVLYSSLQQFRLLFSHKINKDNKVKIFCKKLSKWRSKQVLRLRDCDMLYMSMITNVDRCEKLDVVVVEKVKRSMNATVNIDDKEYDKLIDMVEEKLECFRLMDNSGTSGIHELRRTRQDIYCPLCTDDTGEHNIAHQNENGYLIIGHNGDVKFYCYRHDNKSVANGTPKIGYVIGTISIITPFMDAIDEQLMTIDSNIITTLDEHTEQELTRVQEQVRKKEKQDEQEKEALSAGVPLLFIPPTKEERKEATKMQVLTYVPTLKPPVVEKGNIPWGSRDKKTMRRDASKFR